MYSLILHGRSLVQLQKRRSFSVSVTLLHNASTSFSSSTSLVDVASPRDSRKGKNFTVSYLVGSLGLPTKLAESISRRVSFEDKTNPDSVLSLFRSHGFTASQISTIITDHPRLLLLDAEKSLAPKLNSLQSRGGSADELTEIVSKVPKILDKREGRSSNRYYDVVRDILAEADKSSNKESCNSSSRRGNKIRNVLVLRDLGMPQKLFLPLLISLAEPVCGKQKFEVSLKKVVEMGFDPTTSKFVTALRMLYQMSDKTVQEKVNLYKTLGFAVEDVWEMFKKYPFSLAYSEKKIMSTFETFLDLGLTRDEFAGMIMSSPQCIGFSAEALRRKTEFLVGKMNWPLKALVGRPQVYNYSMEKMIVPRSNVIGALMSRRLLRDGGSETPPPLPSVFACTEQAFLNRYVLKVDDKELVAELMAIFSADSAS